MIKNIQKLVNDIYDHKVGDCYIEIYKGRNLFTNNISNLRGTYFHRIKDIYNITELYNCKFVRSYSGTCGLVYKAYEL